MRFRNAFGIGKSGGAKWHTEFEVVAIVLGVFGTITRDGRLRVGDTSAGIFLEVLIPREPY